MKINYNSMNIFVVETYDAMSKRAANMVAGQMNIKEGSVLGLATGSTPEGMYKELVQQYKEDRIDFSGVTTFNLDEYIGLEADNDQSYAYYMNENLFKHVNVDMENVHIPDGVTDDVEAMCREYDHMIEKSGNMDIQILGIGGNGHIGFNEPDEKLEAGTHLVKLVEETIEANSRFFNSIDDVPKEAVSMGIRNIMHAKKVVLMANGAHKAQAVYDMIFGPVTTNLPASVLQIHNDATIILEKEAATLMLEEFKKRGVI